MPLKALLRSMLEMEFEPPREKKEEWENVRTVMAVYMEEVMVMSLGSLI
jgi:hypothetical protein